MSKTLSPLTPMHYPNFRVAYADLARATLKYGAIASPRGLTTKELLGVNFVLEDMTDTLATQVNRSIATKFAAADALMVLGGFTDHEWASKYSRQIANYGTHGAYGPRIAPQMDQAIERLKLDRSTRRSVVQIWDPVKDLFYDEDKLDYPCTTELQFLIRGGRLDIHVRMRANDVFLGLPYDVFQFAQVALTVGNLMGVAPGRYYHHVTSFHAYEKHWDKLEGLVESHNPPLHRPLGFGVKGESWDDVMADARGIRDNSPLGEVTSGEDWFHAQLNG